MIIKTTANSIDLDLHYSDDGRLDHVTESKSGKSVMIHMSFSGCGYCITEDKTPFGSDTECDARYAKIIEHNLYIPIKLFIKGN